MSDKLDDIALRSEEVQEILTAVPNWMIRWGSLLLFFLLLMLLIISWVIKYPDTIVAQATVTTYVPPQKVYSNITARITAIVVEDGQEVVRNQPLAILENTADYKSVFQLKAVMDTININNQRINFPLDSLPSLVLGDISAQFALFENSYLQYQLNKLLEPFSNEAVANRIAISALNNQVKSLQAQKKINKTELDLQKKDLNRQKGLLESGVISEQDFENEQLEYAQVERNYKSFDTNISQVKEGIANINKSIKQAEINHIKEEVTLLKNVIQSFDQLEKAIRDWEQLYVLKSHMQGKVSFLNYWSANQTVSQGDLVFTIIPEENSLFVGKLKAPSQNAGKIKIGQAVFIRLDNYPDTEFGTLRGSVKNISLVPGMEGLYFIDVALPKELITSYNKKIDFKQEMSGSAEIVTEDLRLIERFFYQFRDLIKV